MTGAIPKPIVKHPDPDVKVFLGISSALTGYSEVELEGTGMVEDYFCVLMKEQDHEGVRAFFDKAEEILSNPRTMNDEIRKAFIDLPPVAARAKTPFDQMYYQGLAQRIMLLWYTGDWTTMNWKDTKTEQERTSIVSAEAYQQGLIWGSAGSHPAGAKQPGYGSWQEEPPHSLKRNIVKLKTKI